MKTKIFTFLVFLTIIFTACKLDGSVNNTPRLELSCINLTTNDTLSGYLTDESNVFRLDTIEVGDTLLFKVAMYGYYNNLTNFYIQQSDTSATKILLPTTLSLDSIFASTQSDYKKGKFVFKKEITNAFFPFRYVARKEGSQILDFFVASDAKFDDAFGNNSANFKLKIPIKVNETNILK